jgi:hypothetical protein
MLTEVKEKHRVIAIMKGPIIKILFQIIHIAENRDIWGIVPASISGIEPVLPS